MRKTRAMPIPLPAVLLIPVLSGCLGAPAAGQNANPPYMETTRDYGLLRWDNKALFNNQWGQGYLASGAVHSGKMFYDPKNDLIGWEWSWPVDRPEELKAYPVLIIGDKPFTPAGIDESTDPRFPLYLPEVKEIWFEGEISVSGTGDFDFAFDLNLLAGRRSAPEAIRTEIMIWVYANKVCGAKKTGAYLVDGIPYDLYISMDWNPAIPYLAFGRKGSQVPRRFPLHEFFAIAFQLGFYGPQAYLSAIELGAEIWHGSGKATLRNLSINLVRQ